MGIIFKVAELVGGNIFLIKWGGCEGDSHKRSKREGGWLSYVTRMFSISASLKLFIVIVYLCCIRLNAFARWNSGWLVHLMILFH